MAVKEKSHCFTCFSPVYHKVYYLDFLQMYLLLSMDVLNRFPLSLPPNNAGFQNRGSGKLRGNHCIIKRRKWGLRPCYSKGIESFFFHHIQEVSSGHLWCRHITWTVNSYLTPPTTIISLQQLLWVCSRGWVGSQYLISHDTPMTPYVHMWVAVNFWDICERQL